MNEKQLIDLEPKQLKLLKTIIKRHIPNKTVWAYGSRVTWKASETSDLDLAVFDSNSGEVSNLKESFVESSLLVSVDVMDWESIPDSFKENIKKKYVVVQQSSIPEGWREVKLGEICLDVSYGYTASASNESIGPKFLRITDVVPKLINWDNVPYCKIGNKDKIKYSLAKGDIVIARTGATTGYNKIIRDSVECVFASYLIRYKINKEIADPFYIGHILQSSNWRLFIDQVKGGSAQPGVNAKQISGFQILLPPLPQQKAIAEILSSLDDKIELLHRQNKTLEDTAQALFRKWFVEDADEDWEERKLGKLVEFTKGRKPTRAEDAYFEGSEPQILIETFDTGKVLYSEKDGGVVAESKDVLMVMDGASSGRTEIGFRGIVGSTIGLYKPLESFNYPFFIFSFLKNREQYIKENTTGSAIPHVDKQLVSGLTLKFPNTKTILNFDSVAEQYFTKKKSNIDQVRTLESLRDVLLSKLMCGKAKVNH